MSLVEMSGIWKQFPNVVALKGVDFSLCQGEVHALIGENGAGKSTLMNILYGVVDRDEGDIFVNGIKQNIRSTRDAKALGIGMVHQDFMLAPSMTVVENIILGDEPRRHGILDYHAALHEVKELSKKYGLAIRPESRIVENSVGEAQRVEILKALYRRAEILILDEPTAVLTPQEADELFSIIRSLKETGISVVFISHKLREVMEISDRITVMRRGEIQGTLKTVEATREKLASLMVGRDVFLDMKPTEVAKGPVILEVKNICARGRRRLSDLEDISFKVHAGEILGVAGVDGNGQSELIEVITGLRKSDSGEISISGQNITNLAPGKIRQAGVSHIAEDRNIAGLCQDFTVAENLIATKLKQRSIAKGFVLNFDTQRAVADRLIKEYDIRPTTQSILARNLSGGNKQKIVVAREVSEDAQLLVAAHPTRGLDIGSIEFIRSILLMQREMGKAIVLISADLEEILSLSDRIAVMYEGKIVGIVPISQASEKNIGLMMGGVEYSECTRKGVI